MNTSRQQSNTFNSLSRSIFTLAGLTMPTLAHAGSDFSPLALSDATLPPLSIAGQASLQAPAESPQTDAARAELEGACILGGLIGIRLGAGWVIRNAVRKAWAPEDFGSESNELRAA